MTEKIRMCSMCAGAFRYEEQSHEQTPDTHGEIGEECPTLYRE